MPWDECHCKGREGLGTFGDLISLRIRLTQTAAQPDWLTQQRQTIETGNAWPSKKRSQS